MSEEDAAARSLPKVTGVHVIGVPGPTSFAVGYNRSKGAQHYNTRVVVPGGKMTVGPNCPGLTCTVSDLVPDTVFQVTVVAHASGGVYSPPSDVLMVRTAS